MINKHLSFLYIQFVAAVLLIAAGAIHSFPVLWSSWDTQMQEQPWLHHIIGGIGFVVGIANLGILSISVFKK